MTSCVKLRGWNPGKGEKKACDNGHNGGLLITARKAGLFIELLSIKAFQTQSKHTSQQQLSLPPSLLFPDTLSGHLWKHCYANAQLKIKTIVLFEDVPRFPRPLRRASLSRE